MSLKDKLKNNTLTIGSWLTIAHQSVVEIMATAGFDWLAIDMEHAAIGYESAQNVIGHIQGNGMKALVRVSKNEEVVIKRILDAGADGVIVPMIKNAQEAKQAVEYVKYPPEGKRGVGLSRAQQYGIGLESYKKWLKNQVLIIAQIEHVEAVENLESILQIEGIDGIIVGPYDLSASMGLAGELTHPKVLKSLQKIHAITKLLNKPLGFHVIQPNYEDLQNKISEGYTFLAFSLDFFFLGNKVREEMQKLDK